MNTQSNSEDHNRPQVSYKTYHEGYDDPVRLDTYREHVNQVLKFKPSSALEVGIGNKSVYLEIKKRRIKIIGLDYARDLEPDVVGNVIALPFKDDSFDTVLCAEVLEHLPFEKSIEGLRELKRVAKKYIVLTLPQLSLDNRFFRRLKSKPFTFDGQHYWELGSGKCSLKGIKKIFEIESLKLLDCFAFNVFRLHRFEWLTELLYKIHQKSRLLKFNGYPVFFVLQKKGG